ncbi:hypothetical protein P2318_01695 [Myxococcaceae bacterium GXIMD 01537]
MSQTHKLSSDGYHLVDSGVRCMRAPCPSVRATPLAGGPSFDVTDVVSAPSLVPGQQEQVNQLMSLPDGLHVRGTVRHDGPRHIFTVEEVLPR